MSRVGARRERERAVPRATGVPRLAKPARHARYARVAPRSFGVWPPARFAAFTPAHARRAGAGCRRLPRLGGEERIEDAVANRWLDAVPVVDDLDHHRGTASAPAREVPLTAPLSAPYAAHHDRRSSRRELWSNRERRRREQPWPGSNYASAGRSARSGSTGPRC